MSKLAHTLQRIAAWEPPITVTGTVNTMLSTMAAALPAEDAAPFRAFLDNPTWDLAHALPVDGDLRLELNAIIANTAVPTIVHGGHQINVIPSEITLDVDGRILPGQDGEAFRADIQRLVGDDIEVELVSGFNGLEASPSSPFSMCWRQQPPKCCRQRT